MIRRLTKIQIDRNIQCPATGAHADLFVEKEGSLEIRLDDASGMIELRATLKPDADPVCIHRDRCWSIRYKRGDSPFDAPPEGVAEISAHRRKAG